jgi:hypothetical protein
MGIMQSDRWCMPWVRCYESTGFDVKFCVDGKGYVEQFKTGEAYCFETHLALAQYLDQTKRATFRTRLKVRFGAHTDDCGMSSPISGTRSAASIRPGTCGLRKLKSKLSSRCFQSPSSTRRNHPPM